MKGTILLSETTPEGVLHPGILRQLIWTPSWDKRSSDQSKNYGIHNVDLAFCVSRGNAAVEWRFFTTWFIKELRPHIERHGIRHSPDGLGDISTHSPVPLYEGETPSSDHCEFTSGQCYSDGSGMASCELFDKACADPSMIWPELEQRLLQLEAQIEEQKSMARNYT